MNKLFVQGSSWKVKPNLNWKKRRILGTMIRMASIDSYLTSNNPLVNGNFSRQGGVIREFESVSRLQGESVTQFVRRFRLLERKLQDNRVPEYPEEARVIKLLDGLRLDERSTSAFVVGCRKSLQHEADSRGHSYPISPWYVSYRYSQAFCRWRQQQQTPREPTLECVEHTLGRRLGSWNRLGLGRGWRWWFRLDRLVSWHGWRLHFVSHYRWWCCVWIWWFICRFDGCSSQHWSISFCFGRDDGFWCCRFGWSGPSVDAGRERLDSDKSEIGSDHAVSWFLSLQRWWEVEGKRQIWWKRERIFVGRQVFGQAQRSRQERWQVKRWFGQIWW